MTNHSGIFIALGSNLSFEDLTPVQILRRSVERIRDLGMEIKSASSIYETPPFPVSDQPNFANAVIEVKTELPANAVLDACLKIEHGFARERATRWGARTLDLDLLAYDDQIVPNRNRWMELAALDDADIADLVVPHPRLHKRMFVLLPLMEIAPDWCHPVFMRTSDVMIKSAEQILLQQISEKLL